MPKPATTQGGLDGAALAGSCFRAFSNATAGATGQPGPEWEQLDESSQDAFSSVARTVQLVFESEEEGGSYRLLAANCDWNYRRAAGEQPVEREQIPLTRLLAWEAFCRHCCNMLMLDADEDGPPGEHEIYWLQWAKDKVAAAALPQPLADAQRPQEED